ncbi:MAG: hypothetical protein VYD45_02290 [Pseudomonadota bacterium]|nr:hypothetical protein [Pseudomonadota bacterium]
MRLPFFAPTPVKYALLLASAFALSACSSNLRFDDDEYQPLNTPSASPLAEEKRAWS